MCDDDMTPEEFDELWEKAEPVDAIVRLNRPRTFGSGRSYNFTWSPETGLQERQ